MSAVPAVVYLRDRFVNPSEARISLFDRGYLFGDSIFETLRVYVGVPFALDAHLDRLEHSSAVTGIQIPVARHALSALVGDAVTTSGLSSAYVRVTVSRGEGGSGIGTLGADDPTLSIIVREHVPYPAGYYDDGVDSITLETRKIPAACLDPAMKSGNYLPNVLARRELERRGLTEGVMLSTTDSVVCGTVSNLFLVRAGALQTPDEASGCRPGVTRAILLELAEACGLRPAAQPISRADLEHADEAFFANTLMECLPLRSLDGRGLRSAESGSSTRRLHAAYREAVVRATSS